MENKALAFRQAVLQALGRNTYFGRYQTGPNAFSGGGQASSKVTTLEITPENRDGRLSEADIFVSQSVSAFRTLQSRPAARGGAKWVASGKRFWLKATGSLVFSQGAPGRRRNGGDCLPGNS